MRKNITVLFLLFSTYFAFSQEISLKYGKITEDELKMTVYDKDTSAVAVVLYEDGNVSYSYSSNTGFQLALDLKMKVKILKSEGTGRGDISIPYYVRGGNSGTDKEVISGLEAYAYNLENGKITKTKLSKKYIFDEEVNNRVRRIKFSIPNVKAGTVIEYKYRKISPFLFDIPAWNVQSDIPVLNSSYEVLIPEYYFFNVDAMRGYEHIITKESSKSQSFNIANVGVQSTTVHSNSRQLNFTAKDVPALKSEPYVWCLNDFISGVSFEFKGSRFPNQAYKPYSNTWQDIEETLMKSDFGNNMKMSNPYRDEIRAIVAESKTEEEIITKIYALVRENIRWNETYSFLGNKARDAVKNGTGDNGQINMILLSALKDAYINAYPILISTRPNGRLSFVHPSLDKLNTFIVATETFDKKIFYLDGSAVYGGLNVLPINLLVDRAWAFKKDATGDKWVNLTNLGRNQEMTTIKATIDENGVMTCEKGTRYSNQIAYSFKSDYFSKKDSAEYIENYENANKITVNSHLLEGLEPMSNAVTEQITFIRNLEFVGDYAYINPLIFTHFTENPFTQSERKLPIEFNYPYVYTTTVVLTIPENYTIDEIPVPLNIALENNAGRCLYEARKVSDNTIHLNYRFELNQIFFSPTDYEMIRELYGQVAAKNKELVVLKKI